jgi:hypothetical protein
MTETLAKVYLEQKNIKKQYKHEILILKYPEKVVSLQVTYRILRYNKTIIKQ